MSRTAYSITADDFKTQEYWNSTGLDVINASAAYALGYTGQGVALGILDTPVLTTHPELLGKVLGTLYPAGYPLDDWARDSHGTHVAGIMVAKRDGIGMQGVAFDAGLYAVAIDLRENVTHLPPPDFLSYFAALPNVKILNNSWGRPGFPYESGDSVSDVVSSMAGYAESNYLTILVNNYDKVAVFAAGNSGHASAEMESIAPRYIPSLKGWINVVSIDPTAVSKVNGVKVGDVNLASIFSNMGKGASLFTVAAPGTNINSLSSLGSGTGYRIDSGTSMAAPYVSGALGLVQQAFPWMTGKQLVDSVLTTADNPTNGRFVAPNFTMTIAETEASGGKTYQILMYYIDRAVPGSVLADLQTYYTKNAANLAEYGIRSYDDLVAAYGGTLESFVTAGLAQSVTFADVFGQGILNVGLAVRGPAILDANRLSSSDYSAAYGCALYSVDTKGYTSVFSNDISQRQWDNSLHHSDFQYVAGDDVTDPDKADALALLGQNVGLLKAGDGTLILTGYNTYAGATVVRGGTLSITRVTGVANSGTLVNSNVYVESEGLLTGNGTVVGTVSNMGVFLPGNGLGSSFTVGTYRQYGGGLLALLVDSDGSHNSLSATNMYFAGGTVGLITVPDYYPNKTLTFSVAELLGGTIQTWQSSIVAGWYNVAASDPLGWSSPTLDVTAAVIQVGGAMPTAVTLTYSRATNAYSRYATSSNDRHLGGVFDQSAGAVLGDAQNLVTALDFSAEDGSDVRSALSQLGTRQYAASAQATMGAQRGLNSAMLAMLFGGANRIPGTLVAKSSSELDDPWSAFLTPFGGVGHIDAGSGQSWSALDWAGGLAGLESDSVTETGAWTLGGHLGCLHSNQVSGGPGTNRASTDGFYLGGQFRFAPQKFMTPDSAFHTFGMARLGMEATTQRRGVSFNGYTRTASSDWVMPVGSLLAGAGWDYSGWRALGGQVVAGPLAWLEYSTGWRPPVTEGGGQAINLKLESGWVRSLRSSLGGRIGLRFPVGGRPDALMLDFLTVWNHEFMSDHGNIRAKFAGFGNSFSYTDAVRARDSVTVGAGVAAKCGEHLGLGLSGGTELASDRSNAWGSVNLSWTF